MAFQPVPTYADPVDVNPRTGKSQFNPAWLSWFLSLSSGGLAGVTAHNGLAGLQGGTTAQFYHLSAADYTNRYVKNNGAQSSITVGASPFTYTNGDAFEEDVVVVGGTVSAVVWSRNAFGATVTYPIAGPIRLAVGDAVRITYSVAPTLLKVPR